MPESPRPPRPDDGDYSRRRVVAAGGTALTAALAGCTGLSFAGPRTLETAVHEDSADELSWDFPGEPDTTDIGYVELTTNRHADLGGSLPSRAFTVTVGIDPDSGYELRQLAVTVSTPPAYFEEHGRLTYFVSPPTQGDQFDASYRRLRDGTLHRELAVELSDVEMPGTIDFPIVVRHAHALPSSLRCSFSVRASEPGSFGERVRAADSGTFAFASDDSANTAPDE